MSTFVLPCLLFAFAPAQNAKLEIANVHGTYGHLGADRPKGKGILPGDTLFYTFEIQNLTFDKTGTAKYSVEVKVVDADGKLFYHQKPFNAVTQNFFGGKSLPYSSFLQIPLDAKPGAVRWTLTIRDRIAKKSAALTGEGKILKPAFGFVQVGTFADAEGRVPSPAVAVVGEGLYLNFAAVGFGRDEKTGKPSVDVKLRILDENGKPTTKKPLEGKVHEGVGKNARLVPLQFGLPLTRAGRFTLELIGRCEICNATTSLRIPIQVLER